MNQNASYHRSLKGFIFTSVLIFARNRSLFLQALNVCDFALLSANESKSPKNLLKLSPKYRSICRDMFIQASELSILLSTFYTCSRRSEYDQIRQWRIRHVENSKYVCRRAWLTAHWDCGITLKLKFTKQTVRIITYMWTERIFDSRPLMYNKIYLKKS